MALTRGELARKVVHMGVGTIAFSLRFLGPLWAAILALCALAMNLFVLPHIGGRKLWREHEVSSGTSIGIILYPLTVLLLILVFWRRLEVAAAAWGILAFGDGMASVAGMSLGRSKLPWNPRKSWMGSLAYVLFGTVAAAVLLIWTAPNQGRSYGWAFALAACFLTTLLAAALESLPQGLDDNLGVPLVSGLFLLGLVVYSFSLAIIAQAQSNAQELNNASIAKTLFLTDRAVEKHINSMFHKLGLTEEPDVHRRVMAVLAFLRETELA